MAPLRRCLLPVFMAGSLLGMVLLCASNSDAAVYASSSLPIISSALALLGNAAANKVLDEKINIHRWSSDDESSSDDNGSDDDEDADDYQEGDGDDPDCLKRNPNGSCAARSNVQHFYNDFGELEFKWTSCNDSYGGDVKRVAVERSLYQKVTFEENVKKGDKCLRLDTTLQQCSSYRPHYHEPFVHYSASYLNKGGMSGVRRVVFVGGGDSMLLHEILKYEQLELVLALELDQKVTRNSFEHFKTQPHFDDPRVQWWFGDGAKSLTLLPREYFGTFDLVLLGLSETVWSEAVMGMVDAFGLLLSPTGILAKNDFGYFEKFAKVFDTCIQLIIPDVNYICDFELVLCGSDEVNFLEPTFDHLKGVQEGSIEALIYKPQEDIADHWGPVTDFSKYWGEPRECLEEGADNGTDVEIGAHAGILMVVEAENVSPNIKDAKAVTDAVEKVVKGVGFNVISTTSIDGRSESGVVVALSMKEGYIVIESWPAAKYCKIEALFKSSRKQSLAERSLKSQAW